MSHFAKITPAEMRDIPRKHVLMQATILGAGGSQRVFVKDLTLTGARIQYERDDLEEGDDVIFKRGDDFRAACVAWTRKGEAGIQFYRES